MSISDKHNHKTFSKSPNASLLHCIGNILSHSSGKWRDSLTMAALSFTFVQYLFTNYQLEKKLIPIPLLGYVHTVPDRFLLRFKSCSGTV